MRWALAAAIMLAGTAAARSESHRVSIPPLYDPVFLNIGFVCRWESRCMNRQDDARKRSLKFVQKKSPPSWRVELCNRNAGRHRERVDWIGFEHCIRNETLSPAPAPSRTRRTRAQIMAERGR